LKLNIHIQTSNIIEGKILNYMDIHIQHSTIFFQKSTFNIHHSTAFERTKDIGQIQLTTFTLKKKKTPTPAHTCN
jgi:hypothetical protein